MKKFLSIGLIISMFFGCFSITSLAQDVEKLYIKDCGCRNFSYYKDAQGNPYIVEDGIKYYVEIPDYVEKVTDEAQLERLREEYENAKLQISTRSNILFERTIYFASLPSTGALGLTQRYLYLKCSELNPSNATRGFSYWIFYPVEADDAETEWERAFYINKSLSSYTRHDMAIFVYPSYVKIEIFSYYDSVTSCLFSVKEGGILG